MINLDKISLFVGCKSELLREVLSEDWVSFDCFNDYKIAFINKTMNKSIIAKVHYTETDCSEVINNIWVYDGIYNETEKTSISAENIISHVNSLLNKKQIVGYTCLDCGEAFIKKEPYLCTSCNSKHIVPFEL
jgi:hypothetical protein